MKKREEKDFDDTNIQGEGHGAWFAYDRHGNKICMAASKKIAEQIARDHGGFSRCEKIKFIKTREKK